MCIWFEVTPLSGNPTEADNAQGLAEAIGCNVSELPTVSGEIMWIEECLCDLDIAAFESKFGYRHDVGETSIDNYLIEVPA
jgi:hypothetical protein